MTKKLFLIPPIKEAVEPCFKKCGKLSVAIVCIDEKCFLPCLEEKCSNEVKRIEIGEIELDNGERYYAYIRILKGMNTRTD